jgi:acetylornithine deacetylase
MTKEFLQKEAIGLLKQLIATPSFSKEEDRTAALIENFLKGQGVKTNRYLNNIWSCNHFFDENKPSILLNSHHDTVKPNKAYTLDPFVPIEKDGKLFGLGSNDAGGSLVSIISVFLYFHNQKDLKYNLILGLSAEEEISGKNGVEALLSALPKIDCAIVGEPTLLQMAVAERGLMVLDCLALGKAGHAARNEGINASHLSV